MQEQERKEKERAAAAAAVPTVDAEPLAAAAPPSIDPPPPADVPLYLHAWSSSSELEREYARRCGLVRRGLQRDIDKAMSDGRSVLIEGALIDPTLFADLLPLCAPIPVTAATAPAATVDAPAAAASVSDSTSASAANRTSAAASPLLVSFHATLSHARQQLLLHNYFAAAATPLPTLPLLSGSATAPAFPPLSHALIWRNLRWLEVIIAERHARWSNMIARHNAQVQAAADALVNPLPADASNPPSASLLPSRVDPSPSSSSPSAILVPAFQSVCLDSLHDAVASMRSTVLGAIAQQLQRGDERAGEVEVDDESRQLDSFIAE